MKKLILISSLIAVSISGCKGEKKISKPNEINYELSKPEANDIKFGLTEKERKQYFKEMINAEDRANSYAIKEEDKILEKKLSKDQLRDEFAKIEKARKLLLRQYESIILKKYNISREQDRYISNEAFSENWDPD